MSDGTLPDDLRDWIESTTGATIVHATRHLAGASRMAWSVDAERGGTVIPLFTLRDSLSSNGGSLRDGAVLTALTPTHPSRCRSCTPSTSGWARSSSSASMVEAT